MNIQPINYNTTAPSFKKTYPVQIVIKEGENFHTITANMTLIKRLQRKIVSILNKSDEYYFDYFVKHPTQNASKSELPKIQAKRLEENIRKIVGTIDIDYRGERIKLQEQIKKLETKIKNMEASGFDTTKEKEKLETLTKGDVPMIRSFYNTTNGDVVNGTWPSFIISGKRDISQFEEECAKDIGRNKGIAKKNKMDVHSESTNAAIDRYNENGYIFVNNPEKRLLDEKGISYYLRLIFEPIRDKKGKIKDYNIIHSKFLPTGKSAPSKY